MDRKQQILSILKTSGPQNREELTFKIGDEIPKTSLLRIISELETEGLVQRNGEGKATTYALTPKALAEPGLWQRIQQQAQSQVSFNSKNNKIEDPVLEVTVNNPLTGLKRWLQKLLNNEGIDLKFSLKIKPLTAIGIVLVVVALSLGLTTIGVMLKYLPFYNHIQEFVTKPDNSRLTAMEGKLIRQEPGGVYFLFVPDLAEAVVIDAPILNLTSFVNQYVIVSGKYNRETNRLEVDQINLALF